MSIRAFDKQLTWHRLQKAGVAVQYITVHGVLHGFYGMAKHYAPLSHGTHLSVAEFIQRRAEAKQRGIKNAIDKLRETLAPSGVAHIRSVGDRKGKIDYEEMRQKSRVRTSTNRTEHWANFTGTSEESTLTFGSWPCDGMHGA